MVAGSVCWVSSLTVRYNYRLRPGRQGEAVLVAEWGRCRWIWNQCVTTGRRKPYRSHPLQTNVDLREARAKLDWLAEGAQNPQEQLMRTFRLKRAKGARAKTIKKRHSRPTLNYSTNGFSIKNGRLCLAKCPPIPVVWSRELPSVPTSVRVFQDSLGHWYASFVVEVEQNTLPQSDNSVGIDWGVTAIATASDPAYDLAHPQYGKRNSANLAKYQRRMARRKPTRGQSGSRGYKHAKRQAAKAHKKVSRQRQHTARVWANRVVADHGLIAVEDFKPKFLAKSTMARKAADGVIGGAKRELISIARRAGRSVVIVAPAYTTMTCSSCSARTKQRLPLSQRTFVCTDCGLIADRDRNAAKTILAQGESNLASADDVRQFGLPSGERLVAV